MEQKQEQTKKKYLYIAALGLALVLMIVIVLALMPDQPGPDNSGLGASSTNQPAIPAGPNQLEDTSTSSNPGETANKQDKDSDEGEIASDETDNLTEDEAGAADDAEDGEDSVLAGDEKNKSPETDKNKVPLLKDLNFTNLDFQVVKQKGKIDVTYINDQLYFDLETLARYYGKKFAWDTDKQGREQFFIRLFGVDIKSAHLSETAELNGKDSDLGAPVYRLGHRTLIPADALAGHLGAKFEPNFDDGVMDIKFTNILKALRTVFN